MININKVICGIVGHKLEVKKCPYSKASASKCLRCVPKETTNRMSFN